MVLFRHRELASASVAIQTRKVKSNTALDCRAAYRRLAMTVICSLNGCTIIPTAAPLFSTQGMDRRGKIIQAQIFAHVGCCILETRIK